MLLSMEPIPHSCQLSIHRRYTSYCLGTLGSSSYVYDLNWPENHLFMIYIAIILVGMKTFPITIQYCICAVDWGGGHLGMLIGAFGIN